MVRQQLFIGAALVVGAAIGFFAKTSVEEARPAAPVSDDTVQAKLIEDKGAASIEASLRARIADLEARLASAEGRDVGERADKVAESAPPAPPRGGDFRARMEEMKKNDPAGYAQMTNRFAQMRQRQLERQQAKLDFLSSVDVSRMSEAAQKTHGDLQDAIVRVEDLRDRLHQADLSDKERGEVFEELMKTEREINRLNAAERRNLLAETAKAIGLKGDDRKVFLDTVGEIIKATDGGGFRPPHGGRRGGRGR